jgi:hypothetical protein
MRMLLLIPREQDHFSLKTRFYDGKSIISRNETDRFEIVDLGFPSLARIGQFRAQNVRDALRSSSSRRTVLSQALVHHRCPVERM